MDERLTTTELAERLGVSERTIAGWRSEGLPVLKRGGPHGHLHPWGEVKEWLASNDRAGFVPMEEGSG